MGYFVYFSLSLFLYIIAMAVSALTIAYQTWLFYGGFLGLFTLGIYFKFREKKKKCQQRDGWYKGVK